MTFDYLLIDVSNLYHRAYAGNREDSSIRTADGILMTGGIRLFIKMLADIERKYLRQGGVVFCLFDNFASIENRRKVIDPDYKANRYKFAPIFYRGLDYINLILLSYGTNYVVVQASGCEADDLVEPILRRRPAGTTALVVSHDQDWARAIGPDVQWLDEHTLVDEEGYRAKYGYPASRETICLWKALCGDESDHIPAGVPNLNREVADKIACHCECVEDVARICRPENRPPWLPEPTAARILSKLPRVSINYKLVDYLPVTDEEIAEALHKCTFVPETLGRLYSALGFIPETVDKRLAVLAPDRPLMSKFFQPKKAQRL